MVSTENEMVAGTLKVNGKRFVVVPEAEYKRLRERAAEQSNPQLPELPRKLSSGNLPAVEAMRVGLARKLITRRSQAGLSQAEVARRAGIRPETLNRIEKAKVTADTSTVAKIARVLDRASGVGDAT